MGKGGIGTHWTIPGIRHFFPLAIEIRCSSESASPGRDSPPIHGITDPQPSKTLPIAQYLDILI